MFFTINKQIIIIIVCFRLAHRDNRETLNHYVYNNRFNFETQETA